MNTPPPNTSFTSQNATEEEVPVFARKFLLKLRRRNKKEGAKEAAAILLPPTASSAHTRAGRRYIRIEVPPGYDPVHSVISPFASQLSTVVEGRAVEGTKPLLETERSRVEQERSTIVNSAVQEELGPNTTRIGLTSSPPTPPRSIYTTYPPLANNISRPNSRGTTKSMDSTKQKTHSRGVSGVSTTPSVGSSSAIPPRGSSLSKIPRSIGQYPKGVKDLSHGFIAETESIQSSRTTASQSPSAVFGTVETARSYSANIEHIRHTPRLRSASTDVDSLVMDGISRSLTVPPAQTQYHRHSYAGLPSSIREISQGAAEAIQQGGGKLSEVKKQQRNGTDAIQPRPQSDVLNHGIERHWENFNFAVLPSQLAEEDMFVCRIPFLCDENEIGNEHVHYRESPNRIISISREEARQRMINSSPYNIRPNSDIVFETPTRAESMKYGRGIAKSTTLQTTTEAVKGSGSEHMEELRNIVTYQKPMQDSIVGNGGGVTNSHITMNRSTRSGERKDTEIQTAITFAEKGRAMGQAKIEAKRVSTPGKSTRFSSVGGKTESSRPIAPPKSRNRYMDGNHAQINNLITPPKQKELPPVLRDTGALNTTTRVESSSNETWKLTTDGTNTIIGIIYHRQSSLPPYLGSFPEIGPSIFQTGPLPARPVTAPSTSKIPLATPNINGRTQTPHSSYETAFTSNDSEIRSSLTQRKDGNMQAWESMKEVGTFVPASEKKTLEEHRFFPAGVEESGDADQVGEVGR
ncbi:hypothetical protein G7Y89_g2301 [Cudoniella acicularis]|uniref:Uncharacterized protein n=1 Tax=Cudoniella acicularis TaxID=354080 RepID=A0A8H4W9G9_9HELO|nr:hypothetical protein G7Y89_g2301 [Cudoniella acicularis]